MREAACAPGRAAHPPASRVGVAVRGGELRLGHSAARVAGCMAMSPSDLRRAQMAANSA
jgi:hypothetical protein